MDRLDEWTIGNLFEAFHNELRHLKTQNRKGHIDFAEFYDHKEELKKEYVQAINLLYTNKRLSFSDLMTIPTFCDIVDGGGINGYDGSGYWIDWDGNKIAPITWREENPPEGAVFVAWYNK